jgi:hypothetical protein
VFFNQTLVLQTSDFNKPDVRPSSAACVLEVPQADVLQCICWDVLTGSPNLIPQLHKVVSSSGFSVFTGRETVVATATP